LGTGNHDTPPVVAPHPVSIYGGTGSVVGGSIYLSRGSGQEVFSIGQIGFDTSSPATEAITVAGSVFASGANGTGVSGNSLFIGPASVVNGTVAATLINQVALGAFLSPAAHVGGNFSVNDTGSTLAATVNLLGTITGNV